MKAAISEQSHCVLNLLSSGKRASPTPITMRNLTFWVLNEKACNDHAVSLQRDGQAGGYVGILMSEPRLSASLTDLGLPRKQEHRKNSPLPQFWGRVQSSELFPVSLVKTKTQG